MISEHRMLAKRHAYFLSPFVCNIHQFDQVMTDVKLWYPEIRDHIPFVKYKNVTLDSYYSIQSHIDCKSQHTFTDVTVAIYS